MDFGAFVNTSSKRWFGSYFSDFERVENVSDKLSEGELVKVKVLKSINREE